MKFFTRNQRFSTCVTTAPRSSRGASNCELTHTNIYTHSSPISGSQCHMISCLLPCRFEVLMQANMLSSEYDEISDMHKKVLRVSTY